MPARHQVPTLKLLAIRVIAWPDGVYRSLEDSYPNYRSRRHHKNLASTLRRRGTVALNVPPKQNSWFATPPAGNIFKENLTQAIVSAWIRLTSIYDTRWDEIDILECIFKVGHEQIKTLDFLHEGFFMRDGTDFQEFCGVIPYTLSPKKVDPFSWQSLVKMMSRSGLENSVENLSIYFQGASHTTNEIIYRFSTTLQGFGKLKRLVVHGDANDAMMGALGRYCPVLEYLDIRNTQVTEKGIIHLLFKNPNVARRFRNNAADYRFNESILNPLASKLKYLDMSTIPYHGTLMDRDRAVIFACRNLAPTPRRFFFSPGGHAKLFTQVDLQLKIFRTKIMTTLRTHLVDLFIELSRDLWPCLSQGFTHAEVRIDESQEEISFNFYNMDYLVIHLKLENEILTSLTIFSTNNCDFIPLQLIQYLLPNLRHIKASLKGLVQPSKGLQNLRSVTSAIVFCKNTLISLVRHCPNLEYIEVRELFLAPESLTDDDIDKMVCPGGLALEVLRFLFPTEITFAGLKTLCVKCPMLRMVGDLKYWKTDLPVIIKLKFSMNCHNFEFYFEYDRITYSTKKPCPEFY